MAEAPVAFRLDVPESDIADLKARLERTRLPDAPPLPAEGPTAGSPWFAGTDVGYLEQLIAYWRDGFDWRGQEAALNAFPQYKVRLHDIDLHYLAVPGKGPAPMPLLLLHGWPGSVYEFVDIIPRLTDPARFGGDPADAFTVIAPSLPGYGLSFQPGQARFSVQAIADCVADLMTEVLGYETFGAQGGDWGAFTCSCLATRHRDKLIGIHQNMLALNPADALPNRLSPAEIRYAEEIAEWAREETGYIWIQGTRPQTLAFGLNDSPAGLAAWIVDKFHAWTDNDGDVESAVDRDRMLANISLYWFTGAIGSSFWPYYDRLHGAWPIPAGQTVDAPFGYAAFPQEIRRPPRSIAARTYTDIRSWTEMPKGGHFAAMEQPEALTKDVQQFFRALRDN